MNYSCGLGPHLTGSLRRGPSVRRSLSTSKHIGGVDWRLRAQFADQVRCVDQNLDIVRTVLNFLQDFYRRFAAVEHEYADQLVKLTNNMKQRHANEISKRAYWCDNTITSICNTMLGSTLHVSWTHSTMADILVNQLIQRLIDLEEDVIRQHKQGREMMMGCHERVLDGIAKLQTDQSVYASYHASFLDAERAFKKIEEKLAAAQQKASSKGKEQVKNQRYQRAQLDYLQKKEALENAAQDVSKARNNCQLQLIATNKSIAFYFTEEAPDIVDCLTCGFYNGLARLVMSHMSCVESVNSRYSLVAEVFGQRISALDCRKDKASFFKINATSFTQPPPLPFMACKEDSENRLVATGSLREDLESQAHSLLTKIEATKGEIAVTCQVLEHLEKQLLDLINLNDYDVSQQFRQQKHGRRSVNATFTSSFPQNNTNSSSPYSGTQGRRALPSTTSSNSLNSFTTSSGQLTDSPQREGLPHPGPAEQTTSGSGDQLVVVGGRNHRLQSSPVNNMESSGSAFMDLRAMYRDSRIEHERLYLNAFNQLLGLMHMCRVLQVKLVEIYLVLGIQPASQSQYGQSFQPGGNPITVSALSSLRFGAVPVLPIAASHSSSAAAAAPVSASPPQSGGPGLPTAGDDATGQPNSPRLPLCSSAANAVQKPTGRRVLRVPNVGKPKLFGATIEEYVAATKKIIPPIILSCVRAIVEVGIHLPGIFRVSGSQAEISEFKLVFERGDDPLVNLCEPWDIHSIIGVFKLYFRELGEPPFSAAIFHKLLECIPDRPDLDDTLPRIRQVILQGMSQPMFIVMRYLFAFLNHITEHSDENCMDAHNLAVCFGPTLMPVPPEQDLLLHQGMVIQVIETIIKHHTQIFDVLVAGPTYNRQAPGFCEAYTVSRSQFKATNRSSCASIPDGGTAAAIGHVKRIASEVAELAHLRMQKTIAPANARVPTEELQQQRQHSRENLSPSSSKSGELVVALDDKLSDTPASSIKSSSVDNLVDSHRSTERLSSNDDGLGKDVDNSCDDLSISDSEVTGVSQHANNTGAEGAPSPRQHSPTETSHPGCGYAGGTANNNSLGTLPEDPEVAAAREDHLRSCRATRDFDSAIDEVVRGLNMSQAQEEDTQESNYRADERNRQLTQKICLPLAKHTPDLVLDLLTAMTKPAVVRESSADDIDDNSKYAFDPNHNLAPSDGDQTMPAALKRMRSLGEGGEATVASGADTFAEQNLDTMRKRSESGSTCRSRLPASLEADSDAPGRAGDSSATRAHETKATAPVGACPPATAANTGVKTLPSVGNPKPPPRLGSPPRPTLPEPAAQKESSPDNSAQRRSIAARVAAFEANSGAQSARPALAQKPRKKP